MLYNLNKNINKRYSFRKKLLISIYQTMNLKYKTKQSVSRLPMKKHLELLRKRVRNIVNKIRENVPVIITQEICLKMIFFLKWILLNDMNCLCH